MAESWQEFEGFLRGKSLEELQAMRDNPLYGGMRSQQLIQNAIYHKTIKTNKDSGLEFLSNLFSTSPPPSPGSTIGTKGAGPEGRGPGEETSQPSVPAFAGPGLGPIQGVYLPPGVDIPSEKPQEAPASLSKVGAVFSMPPATRFTAPTPPSPVDVEGTRKRLSEGMPEARKAEETYKADPYMAMLQTGLRILSAQPQVGQSGLSVIAAPIAQGVSEYRGEKEKERLSKKEEAAAAREEAYKRYGVQRDIEKTILDLAEKTKDRDQTYQNLRLMQEKGASEAEINRAKLALEAATYNLKKTELEGKVSPREALETFQRLDKRRQELESLPSLTPVQQAELEGVTRLQAATQRAFGAYMGVEGRSAVAGEAREVAILRDLEKQISDLSKNPVVTDESRKRLAELRQRYAEISARLGLGSSTWQNPNVVGVTSKQ